MSPHPEQSATLPVDTPRPTSQQGNGKEQEHTVVQSTNVLMTGKRLAVVFSAFCLSFFLVALDQTILSTALPTIASYFSAVKDISWIASAYFLPQAAFMLFSGKLLAVFPAKAIFLVSIIIFELGSLFCAVAPSVEFLIFGRAVAGLGGTGIWSSIMAMIARISSLEQRPILLGLIGVVFAVSSIVGPIIGGAFSDHVTWRWCFYINLPVGGLALLVIIFWLPWLPAVEKRDSVWHAVTDLDWIGTVLTFGFVTFLLIALQYGGNQRPWNDSLVIAFLVLAAVLLLAFGLWESRIGKRAVLPAEVVLNRDVLTAFVISAFTYVAFIVFNYYLPLLFQVRGHSATRSGIDILPFMISGVVTTMVAGGVVSKTGLAWPWFPTAPCLAAVGFGLLFTVDENTSSARLYGFQVLVGVGLGCLTSLPTVVSQAQFSDREELVPLATTFITFSQIIGSSLGLAIGGAVFSSELKQRVVSAGLPTAVLASVKAIFMLAGDQQEAAAQAYSGAIQRTFLIGIPCSSLAALLGLVIRHQKLAINQTAPKVEATSE